MEERGYDPERRFPGLPAPLRIPRGVGLPMSECGGGVVSSEEDDELSWSAPELEVGGVVLGFMETRIEAASRSCTC